MLFIFFKSKKLFKINFNKNKKIFLFKDDCYFSTDCLLQKFYKNSRKLNHFFMFILIIVKQSTFKNFYVIKLFFL